MEFVNKNAYTSSEEQRNDVTPQYSEEVVEEAGWVRVMEVLTASRTLAMALKGAIKLHVLEILAQNTDGKELSAAEIVRNMQGVSNSTAHDVLDRLLRVLASYDVLSSSLHNAEVEGQLPVRKYGLSASGRYLVSGRDGAPSLAALVNLGQHRAILDAQEYIEQAILEGGEPFTLAHGKSIFQYAQHDPQFAVQFNSANASHTQLFMPFLLRAYRGFVGVNTLVDVGGGTGGSIISIVSQYPHIKGINFDQPHVVGYAPPFPGVEHVGGNMFESIPEGDAILMKWVLHDWSDEMCVKILKNCYDALPTKAGKVIVVDAVLSEEVQTTSRARANYNMDLLMFCMLGGGKERTLGEVEAIAQAAGFKSVHPVTQVNEFLVMELHKH